MSDTPQDSRAEIKEGISTLSEAHAELTGLLSELDSELSTSIGQWEENPQSTYVEVQRSWDTAAAKQQEIVQHMPELLDDTPDGDDATQTRDAGMWGQR